MKYLWKLVAGLAGAVAVACVAGAASADSPMFRGNPQLTGLYADEASPRVGEVKFAFHTGGPIRSAPALVGPTLYLGSGDGRLYAIDAETGAERWHVTAGGPVHSSPAVAGGLVYFTSRDGWLYAASQGGGAVKWRFHFGPDLGRDNYWDFFLSSPVVVGRTLYIGSGDGHLYALDARSGRRIWAYDVGARVRTTPAVDGGLVVFGAMDGRLYAVGRADGKLRWRFATEGASRTFADKMNDTTSVVTSPAIGQGVVVAGGRDGFLYGVDLATGKQRWKTTHDGGSWILATTIAGDVVFSGSGSAFILQAAELKTGKEIWRAKTEGAVFSSLALLRDQVVYADRNAVNGIDRATGRPQWRFDLGRTTFATPVVRHGVVYIGADDGVLYALSGSKAAPAPDEVKKYVYWEPRSQDAPLLWFLNDVDHADQAFFAAAGYETLDGRQVAAAMQRQIDRSERSIIVVANDRMPPPLLKASDGPALARRYLDAGGTLALLGLNPAAVRYDDKTGEPVAIDYSAIEPVFGVKYPPKPVSGGAYASKPTAIGRRWGLEGPFIASNPAAPDPALTVLAQDEFNMPTAWVKNYGGPEGTGLIQLMTPRGEITDLTRYRWVIEHSAH